MEEENIEIEFLILADFAEVVGNKLYMMGGGWDRMNVQKLPHRQSFSVAAAISVPWAHTNERHAIKIVITDEDGMQELVSIDGGFEVGRAARIKPGTRQRLMMGFTVGSMEFKTAGVFSIISSVDGEEKRRIQFHVAPSPQLEAQIKGKPA